MQQCIHQCPTANECPTPTIYPKEPTANECPTFTMHPSDPIANKEPTPTVLPKDPNLTPKKILRIKYCAKKKPPLRR